MHDMGEKVINNSNYVRLGLADGHATRCYSFTCRTRQRIGNDTVASDVTVGQGENINSAMQI